MNTHDTKDHAVLAVLRGSFDGVTMTTPVSQIVTEGRARHRRRVWAKSATGVAAVGALALAVGVPALNGATSPRTPALNSSAGAVHVETVAYTVDRRVDGTIKVTWDKRQYFKDHEGLAKALTKAGFPVVIKEGQFCAGPNDDLTLDPSGQGPGVSQVMAGENGDGRGEVSIVFTPSKMPAGKQLFIGYLSPAQLSITHGRPGSVERLVSSTDPLTCNTQAPPRGPARPDPQSR